MREILAGPARLVISMRLFVLIHFIVGIIICVASVGCRPSPSVGLDVPIDRAENELGDSQAYRDYFEIEDVRLELIAVDTDTDGEVAALDTELADWGQSDVSSELPVPDRCCFNDNECIGLGYGQRCVGRQQQPDEKTKVCRPPVASGRCWDASDCDVGEVCHGVFICACGGLCTLPNTGPGVCIPSGEGVCVRIDPNFVSKDCDTQNLVIWDGITCTQTSAGYCGCEPFCDLTFGSLEDCRDACPGIPCGSAGSLPFLISAQGPVPGLGTSDSVALLTQCVVANVENGQFMNWYSQRWSFQLDTGDELKVLVDLPQGTGLPFHVGQSVRLYFKLVTGLIWEGTQRLALVLWDSDDRLLFFGNMQSTLAKWFDCEGVASCPTLDVLAASCVSETMQCGTGYHPPVKLFGYGGTLLSEEGVILNQGERSQADGLEYGVTASVRLETVTCSDWPQEQLSAYIIATPPSSELYERVSSQESNRCDSPK